MALGTAGFTAALSVARLEHVGLVPGTGPVIVTGASGGVGSTAVDILVARGYQVTASTGSVDAHAYLRDLGASEILDRAEQTKESTVRFDRKHTGETEEATGTIESATDSEIRLKEYPGQTFRFSALGLTLL